jgi:glycosyltransferase involved in cell wall biosynthesis
MIEASGSPALVAVGRLAHVKGFDQLLEAFAILRTELAAESATLVILGVGPERPDLEQLARDLGIDAHVRFPGFVENPWAAMGKADVFVLSSRHEGLPLVVAEAVACGLPVVATDCRSGPAEILRGNPRSRLVPVSDPPAMAQAIVEVLADADASPAVPLAPGFTVREAARRYRELLGDILSR